MLKHVDNTGYVGNLMMKMIRIMMITRSLEAPWPSHIAPILKALFGIKTNILIKVNIPK